MRATIFGRRIAAALRALVDDRRMLALLPAALPALAALAPNAIAVVLPVAALGTLLRGRRLLRAAVASPPVRSAGPILCLLVLWSAASILWSIDPGQSASRLAKIVGLSLCGLLILGAATRLTEAERAAWAVGLLAGTGLLLAQIGEELLSGGWVIASVHRVEGEEMAYRLYFLQTGANLLAIVLWPVAVVAWRVLSPVLAAALVAASAALIVMIGAGAAVVALVAGGLAFAAAKLAPRAATMVAAGVMAAGIALAPMVPTALPVGPWMQDLPGPVRFSAYHRAKIWGFTAERIAERPLLGWGLDSARAIPGGDEMVDINSDLGYPQAAGGPPPYESAAMTLPLHPHNAALQLWLELGAVGAGLGLALVVAAAVAIRRNTRQRTDRAPHLATLAAAVVVASLSYGLWQSWWLSTLWLLPTIVAGLPFAAGGGDARADPA